jgi:hypothetical protein
MTKEVKFAFNLPESYQDFHSRVKTGFFRFLREQYPEVKVIGLELDKNAYNDQGVSYAPHGSIIVFDNSDGEYRDYDVTWYENKLDAFMATGVTEVHDLYTEFDTIVQLIDEYCRATYPQYYWKTKYNKKAINNRFDQLVLQGRDKIYHLSNGWKVQNLDGALRVDCLDGIWHIIPSVLWKTPKYKYTKTQKTIITTLERMLEHDTQLRIVLRING